MANDTVSRSWFCVFNNPQDHGYEGEPHEIIERLKAEWCDDYNTRSGAWAYCISADGLKHIHMILEDSRAMRFTAIKKTYAVGMHFTATKGNKQEALDYIHKNGKYAEKGEVVVCIETCGEIKGNQGKRNDLQIIQEKIDSGMTPRQIMWEDISNRRYEKMIKDAYYEKRNRETPFLRDIKVYWHVGASGTGKSYIMKQLADKHGEDYFYLYNDYENGGLDNYNGENVLVMDEFRGQIKYSTLLTMLQGYKTQVHARYTNICALWTEVHITSVMPPEMVYRNMVSENTEIDTLKQLMRRITAVVYHYKENEQFMQEVIPIDKYTSYSDILKNNCKLKDDDYEQEELPFH